MYINLAMLVLVSGASYFVTHFDRRMATFSEVFIILATFNILIYTDFVEDI